MMLVIVFASVTFTSCSDDDDDDVVTPVEDTSKPSDPLVGTWVEKTSTMPFTLVLMENKTGYLSYDTTSRALLTDHFSWSTTESGGMTYINMIHTGGDNIIYSVVNRYVLAGDELILVFEVNGIDYQANFQRR